MEVNTGKQEKVTAIINDTHNPYQDKRALAVAEQILIYIKPDYLVYNGDANDFYQISKFDRRPDRMHQLYDDVRNTRAMFNYHRMLLPNTRFFLNLGNHEYRWQKYLWTKAPELADFDCLKVEELFKLKDYGIEHIEYEEGIRFNGIFLVLHGNICSVNSAYTAKRLFDKHGGCGICGHTHRGGSFYRSNRFGVYGWWENFCLCDLNPDYIQQPDWQHGLSIVYFTGQSLFTVQQIPIINGKCMFGTKKFEVVEG